MSKHTEGPWKFIDGFDNEGETENVLGGIQEVSGERLNIARIWADGPSPLADAHLIAAAPELLSMLKLTRTCIAYCRKNHPDIQHGDGIPLELLIDDLVAKAEGRTAVKEKSSL